MSRQELSRYSWVALLGFAVTLPFVLTGVAIAGAFLPNDEALVSGSEWGTLVGVGVGGAAVGFTLARFRDLRAGHVVRWLASPGAFIAAPLLASAALNHEATAAWRPVAALLASSGLAVEFSMWLADKAGMSRNRASRRTRG